MTETVNIFSPADADASVDCAGCTACCRNNLVVLGESDDLALYPEAITIDQRNPFTGAAQSTVLPHKPNGACIYLSDNNCTIWDRRPKMCRVFSCIDFVARVTAMTTEPQRQNDLRLGNLDRDVWNAGLARQ